MTTSFSLFLSLSLSLSLSLCVSVSACVYVSMSDQKALTFCLVPVVDYISLCVCVVIEGQGKEDCLQLALLLKDIVKECESKVFG